MKTAHDVKLSEGDAETVRNEILRQLSDLGGEAKLGDELYVASRVQVDRGTFAVAIARLVASGRVVRVGQDSYQIAPRRSWLRELVQSWWEWFLWS